MKMLRLALLTSALVLVAGPTQAFVPQTIVIDGTNDFDSSNLMDDDTGDTEALCGADRPLDLGKVFLTNDSNYLYFGMEYRRFCFGDINLGLAIDVNTPAGGTTDPFGRQIGWANLANKPDFIVYDVIPHPGNTFNYEVLYKDNAGAWSTLHDGSNGLGIADADGGNFVEGRILLSELGVVSGATIRAEWWVTQEGATKGPLDAVCSDDIQMSRVPVGSTRFDTTAVVQMTCTLPYTIQAAVDNTPPTVLTAQAVGFPLLANKQFNTATNKIDVTFSEPVNAGTANIAGNYQVTGAATPVVLAASRDAGVTSIVHLTLGSSISANAAFYNVRAINVQDLATNPIVNNGDTNVGSFFIQNLSFEGDMSLRLCKLEFQPTDTFSVEGNLAPLTFTIADNARMYDANTDSVYTVTVPFSLAKDRTTGKAEADLLWKLSHTPSGEPFEPGANRMYHLSSDSGATRTLAAAWANDNPGDFTEKPIDVVFKVDTQAVPGAHNFWLVGSQLPLTFDRPGLMMKDDGVAPDAVLNDDIYTVKVRFPACTPKNVNWKTVWDSTLTDIVYECPGQGDRNVFLNTALFDTIGGTLGPIVLPARRFNRCTVTDKAVAVTFRVYMEPVTPTPGAGDTIAVMGNHAPLNADRPPSAASRLFNDGIPPDASAADKIYTRTVTFPDSTPFNLAFKFWFNQHTNFGFECEGSGDRSFDLDDVNFSAGTPMVRPVAQWNNCATVDVPLLPGPGDAVADFALLKQAFPNPFSATTQIAFDLKRGGHVKLRVYDVFGRRVATLIDRDLGPSGYRVAWNGRTDGGERVRAGIYMVELALGADRLSRRLVVTR